ncbi:MAG: ERF family protein [Ignavibacteriae bacterium]|nr:ERF family protein [Ignavibacteriota bacterium]
MSTENPQNCKIFTSLANFQQEYEQIKFDATVKVQTKSGGTYSFQYATLSNIIQTLRPCLSKHGLSVFQSTEVIENRTFLHTFLNHVSGEQLKSSIEVFTHSQKITSDGKIVSFQMSNQDFAAELSYKKRYQISLITGTVADEDTDANESSNSNTKAFKKDNLKPVEPKQANLDVKKPGKSGNDAFDQVKFDKLFTPKQMVAYFETLLPLEQINHKQKFHDKASEFDKKKHYADVPPPAQKKAV